MCYLLIISNLIIKNRLTVHEKTSVKINIFIKERCGRRKGTLLMDD
jgi:hypothetical protein